MKVSDILNWEISAYDRVQQIYIDGEDIESLTISMGGIVVFHKDGQFTVPLEGDLSYSRPEEDGKEKHGK